jgi:hypothetical protein
MKRLSTLAIGLLIATAALQFSNRASGQSEGEGGWITLLDDTRMGDWDEVGKANWAMKDGAVVADKLLEGKDPAYLVARTSYKDFQIKAEFWTDEEANSGRLHPLRSNEEDRFQDLLRGQYLRQAARPELRHRRDRGRRQGRSDAEGRREMEHLRDHRARPASRDRAQRSEDRRRAGQHASERPVRIAIRPRAW